MAASVQSVHYSGEQSGDPWSFNLGAFSGSNLVAYFFVYHVNNTTTVDDLTVDGVSAVDLGVSATWNRFSGNAALRLWRYIGPASGAAIVVDLSAARTGRVITFIVQDAHQTDPDPQSPSQQSSGAQVASFTNSSIPSAAGELLIEVTAHENVTDATPNAGQTEDIEVSGTSTHASHKTSAGATESMGWDWEGAEVTRYGHVAVSVAAAPGGGGGSAVRRLAGTGGLVGSGSSLVGGHGLVRRSMEKVNGIWRQSRKVLRPRLLVPVRIQLKGV